jgi:hypothetical protein
MAETKSQAGSVASDGVIGHYPFSSALVVFGIGLGVGVAIGRLFVAPSPPPSFGRRAELAAERVGRQILDAVSGVVPESLARHLPY